MTKMNANLNSTHTEWMEKIMAASKANAKAEENETEDKKEDRNTQPEKTLSTSKKTIILGLIFFLLIVAVRVYFLFFVADPQNAGVGWYGDTYHHWQIAYLTKEIGFSHGFLRLWYLKGMEYFWGLAHPLTLVILMILTHSSDIVLTRILSLITGSLSIFFLFLIADRYWGKQVAIAAAIFGAFNPVSIFNDASGMVEPFGMLFLFMGLYFWPRRPWLTGILFAIASMARAEFWLLAVGVLICLFIFTRETMDKKVITAISYIVPIIVYMKYLLNYTGNPIYPIWWNYLGNAAGKWQADIPLTAEQLAVRPIWIAMFILSLLGILLVLWKRPRSMLLHLLGLGNFLFLGFFVGMTEYMKSYVAYFWVVRIFSLPYLYLGLLIGIIFFVFIPKVIPFFGKLKVGWLFIIAILAASQIAWQVIWSYYGKTEGYWKEEIELAKSISSVYKGGTILIHEGDPVMTYAMVNYGGIEGKNIEGQMYDPFQYKPFMDYGDTNLFKNWSKDRKIIVNWLKRDNIKLLVVNAQRQRYMDLIQREPEIFNFVNDTGFGLKIYEVKL